MITKRHIGILLAGGLAATSLGACTPTVRLEIAPIQIYAKLDADVRVRLDKELQDLLIANPNLF
ncbi:YnbE family lipoprotein [uncultured Brevundimonas sp.]|uniref:YnbE family lipoprotein n=1 Tax=uncultured Brevundimonas sp. TaxID=213418 RepID=UPI0030ED4568|tara:strand:- start:106551 stop:106742 length:192 start_codon:yes stop_codon:yes gene_type:complete